MTALYFLGQRLLGSTDKQQTWDGLLPTMSLAHLCPNCGEVWARVVIPGKRWLACTSPCARCEPLGLRTPGSLLLPWHHSQLEELPHEVLRYEFLLRADKEPTHAHDTATSTG